MSKAPEAGALPALCLKGCKARHGQCPWVWPGPGSPAGITRLPREGQGRDEGTARPVSRGAVGQARGPWARPHLLRDNLALAPGRTASRRGDRRDTLSSLREGLLALDSPRPLLKPVGRGGLQPHPGQPRHPLSCPGPAAHARGLPGTLVRCPLGTRVPPHTGLTFPRCPGQAHSRPQPQGRAPVAQTPAAGPALPCPAPGTRSLHLVPTLSDRAVAPRPRRRGGLT